MVEKLALFPWDHSGKKRWPGCEGGLYRGTTLHMNGVRGRVQQRKGLREKKGAQGKKKVQKDQPFPKLVWRSKASA